MTKEETNKYIEELLRYLSFSLFPLPRWFEQFQTFEKAVRALVAERDALKQRVAQLEAALKPAERDWDCFKEGGGA